MGNSCAVAAWQASVHSGNEQGAREARSGIVQSYHSSQVFHGGCSGLLTLLSDLSTVEGVQSLLPDLLPQHRPEIQRRYLTYGPKEVALSFAGKQPDGHSLHRHLRSLTVGSEVLLRNRFFYKTTGEVVGQLAKSVVDFPEGEARGIVKGVMVRLRSQSKPEYINMLKTDRWEVPLVEFISKSN